MARSKASIAPRKSREATRSLPTIKWGFFCSSAFVSLTLSHPHNARMRQALGRHHNNLKNMEWKLNKPCSIRNDPLDKTSAPLKKGIFDTQEGLSSSLAGFSSCWEGARGASTPGGSAA